MSLKRLTPNTTLYIEDRVELFDIFVSLAKQTKTLIISDQYRRIPIQIIFTCLEIVKSGEEQNWLIEGKIFPDPEKPDMFQRITGSICTKSPSNTRVFGEILTNDKELQRE